MSGAPLLVELLTEELPPKSLRSLSETFATKLALDLEKDRFLPQPAAFSSFGTPRRLAVLIGSVTERSPDSEREVQGPSVNAAPQAVAGFAKKNGVAVEALKKAQSPKGEVYVAHLRNAGVALADVLARKVEDALRALPIPKIMRWGSSNTQFVRPVHGLVMVHGKKVVPGTVLGLRAGNRTRGHRFMDNGEVVIKQADEYRETMYAHSVMVDFRLRKLAIEDFLHIEAGKHNGSLGEYRDLLEEVTALVELPAVYVCGFEASFLEVPQECLILTMRQNQKYFPLFAQNGKLLPKFLVVSNMRVKDPSAIVDGNEKVVRPRLEDARFFFNQDRKVRLETRVPQLANVVYHNKLGSQLERVERIQLLAGKIARDVGADPALAERAAWLSKADLLTGMVGEFPELQGIMGGYYAEHDREPRPVVDAIRDQYRLKLDESDPEHLVSASLYLADRIHTLVGFFGVGELPTGERDPFGLRRAALGVISAFELIGAARGLVNKSIPDVRDFVTYAATLFPANKLSPATVDQVHDFILERCWNNLATVFDKKAVEAVLSQKPNLIEVNTRVHAVQAFQQLPEAESLASANKRIRNILRKSDAAHGELDEALLAEPAEKALFDSMQKAEPQTKASMLRRDFEGALRTMATLRGAVDKFFDDVLVNAEDTRVRANRHALLRRLDGLMNQVADISKLAVEK
ncbi:MAG TPA: glycine--tRNA ligase subunit beta [Burkholderiales bacterium]|nr:glycine--tRNA ligase subunit beta [Burkholderiales bacterium]